MSPLIASMLLLLSVAAAPFPGTILIIYVLLLGLAISASGNIKIPISIASSMMAFFISVDLLRAIMFSLPIALLLLLVLKLMARLPHILAVERLDFATVSPYLIVVVSAFVLLPTFLDRFRSSRNKRPYFPGIY